MQGTELHPKRCARTPVLSCKSKNGVTRVQVPGGYVFCISINNLYLYSLFEGGLLCLRN